MLKEIDTEFLQSEAAILNVYILVQVIGFLINSIVYRKNDDFLKAGYK